MGRINPFEGIAAVTQTLTRGTSQTGEELRIWATLFDNRAYAIQVISPALDRAGHKTLINHVVLRLPLPGTRSLGQPTDGSFT
jgi:hypothetical protein